jgi:hypothetical protein
MLELARLVGESLAIMHTLWGNFFSVEDVLKLWLQQTDKMAGVLGRDDGDQARQDEINKQEQQRAADICLMKPETAAEAALQHYITEKENELPR